MENVCNACWKIEKELSQFLKKYFHEKAEKGEECGRKADEKEGKKTRKWSLHGHSEKEKVGMKIDPIRQKSGKVVKNCELYEKNDGKKRECCRNVPVDKKM